MAWFDPRAYGRAAQSRAARLLLFGVSTATLVGLSVLVTGGFAQSPADSAGAGVAAQARGYVPVCTQRKGPNESKGDLNIRLKKFCASGQKPLKLALYPVKSTQGVAGPQGAKGPAGPQGPQGPPSGQVSPAIPTPDYAVVTVYVDRGNGPSRFATYSAQLGSPAGTTTGGDFRFSCTPAQQPCRVSYGAAVISPRSGNTRVYPRLLIHKQADLVAAPITFCEYADGSNNNAGLAEISKVPSLADAVREMQTPLSMGIGGSLDCGSTQVRPPSGTVEELLVPAASAVDTAFYDVSATFAFE
jgi:hypothetical protein